MVERKIKDLSFALEALSRVQGADEEYQSVKTLLNQAIAQAHEEYNPLRPYMRPPSRPNLDDDDIPF